MEEDLMISNKFKSNIDGRDRDDSLTIAQNTVNTISSTTTITNNYSTWAPRHSGRVVS